MLQPNYGIITNIGKAHLEGFGNIETIRKTKLELFDNLIDSNGEIILFNDDELLMNYIPEDIKKHTFGYQLAEINGRLIDQNPYLKVKLQTINTKKLSTLIY